MLADADFVPETADPSLGRHPDAGRTAWLARAFADLAADALIAEVRTTPKPGLVDLRNSGSHRDMDISTFLASAEALRPCFQAFFEAGVALAEMPAARVLAHLRPIGLGCEEAMFSATRGVNTHKGAIFAFGLLLGAAGRLWETTRRIESRKICAEVAAICDGIVERELFGQDKPATAGERLFRDHGLAGARGEAASGFATVTQHALPALKRALISGRGMEDALRIVFLYLMACNDDTNVAARGGKAGLAWAKAQANRLIEAGATDRPDFVARLEALDDAFIERNLSPGGSGDLLAVTWTLHRLETGRWYDNCRFYEELELFEGA